MIPQAWRRHKEFDNIHQLEGVAVITVQLRYNGWITELNDSEQARDVQHVSLASPATQTSCACCLQEQRSHVLGFCSSSTRT